MPESVLQPVTPGLVLALEHELVEAEAEIARHHRDFERIRAILTPLFPPGLPDGTAHYWALFAALKAIRNIVG